MPDIDGETLGAINSVTAIFDRLLENRDDDGAGKRHELLRSAADILDQVAPPKPERPPVLDPETL